MADSISRQRSPVPAPAYSSAASQAAAANRRERLREFQTALSEKLRRAENAPLAVNRLGLQIGSQRLLVDLAEAGEILVVPEIAPVPLTKSWYRGLANVRGNLLGVVDLSLFAGGAATPLDKESRVLVFSTDLRFSAGILVSRMLGLRSAADLSAGPGTSAGTAANLFAPWVRTLLVDAQGGHWQELDLAAIAADERFIDIER